MNDKLWQKHLLSVKKVIIDVYRGFLSTYAVACVCRIWEHFIEFALLHCEWKLSQGIRFVNNTVFLLPSSQGSMLFPLSKRYSSE